MKILALALAVLLAVLVIAATVFNPKHDPIWEEVHQENILKIEAATDVWSKSTRATFTRWQLEEFYQSINYWYYDGKLPQAEILCNDTPEAYGDVAYTDKDGEDGGFRITFDNTLCEGGYELILEEVEVHEIAHVAVWFEAGHGPKWHKEIRRLIDAGAMEGLL